MSTPKQKTKKKKEDKLKKYGIKVEPFIINGVPFNTEKFMLENRFNPNFRQHPEWIEYQRQANERKVLAETIKRDMVDSGLDAKCKIGDAEDKLQKEEMEAYHKSVNSVLSTIGALETIKELTKQQVSEVSWAKAKSKKKLTPEQLSEIPMSKLIEMTNIFVKISDSQLKAISKIVDVEGINKAKKEAKLELAKQNITSIEKFDFDNIHEEVTATDDETGNPVDPQKVKEMISRILN